MSNWPWTLRSPPTGNFWKERSAGQSLCFFSNYNFLLKFVFILTFIFFVRIASGGGSATIHIKESSSGKRIVFFYHDLRQKAYNLL